MGINKNFVVKNGLEVSTDLIVADSLTEKVGIGTSIAKYLFHVSGGIGVTNSYTTGVSTVREKLQVGLDGIVMTAGKDDAYVGFGTNLPVYQVEIKGFSTGAGTTSFFIEGNSKFNGDLIVNNVSANGIQLTSINLSGISTLAVGIITTLRGTNLNYSGIGTIVNVRGTDLSYSGIGTFANISNTNLYSQNAYINTGIITTLSGTNLNYSGVGTVVNVRGTNLNYSGIGTIATFNSTTSNITTLNPTTINNTNLYSTNSYINTGVVTSISGSTATYAVGDITAVRGTNLNYSGIGTIATLNSTTLNNTNFYNTNSYVNTGIITTLSGTNLNYTGIGTITNATGTNLNYSGIGTIVTFNSTTSNITTLNPTTINNTNLYSNNSYINTGVVTSISGSTATYAVGDITAVRGTNLNYSGIGTIATFNSTTSNITTLNPTTINNTNLYSNNSYINTGVVTSISGSTATYAVGDITAVRGTNLNYSGIGTIATFNSTTHNNTNSYVGNLYATSGIVTTLTGAFVNYTGVGTIAAIRGNNINYTGVSTITSAQGTSLNYTVCDIVNTRGTNLNYTGIATIGNVLISNGNVSGIGITVYYYGDGSNLTNTPPGNPAGSNQTVQYNNGGAFAGSNNLTFDGTTVTFGSVVKANGTGVNAGVGIITATDFNSTSDINLKKDISVIDNALELINSIEGVRFKWKYDDKPSMGVIAQQVEKVIPELVSTGDSKTVNYNGFVGVLIEAIKELTLKVEDLERKLL